MVPFKAFMPGRLAAGVLLLLCACGLTGCLGSVNRFGNLFNSFETVQEAKDSLVAPESEERLQDDMTVLRWHNREEYVEPGYYTRRWAYDYRWKRYYPVDVWVPARMRVYECAAEVVADPEGRIVNRKARGSMCDRLVRRYPDWFDPDNPGMRRVTGPAL